MRKHLVVWLCVLPVSFLAVPCGADVTIAVTDRGDGGVRMTVSGTGALVKDISVDGQSFFYDDALAVDVWNAGLSGNPTCAQPIPGSSVKNLNTLQTVSAYNMRVDNDYLAEKDYIDLYLGGGAGDRIKGSIGDQIEFNVVAEWAPGVFDFTDVNAFAPFALGGGFSEHFGVDGVTVHYGLVAAAPALTEWGMIALVLLLAGASVGRLWRHGQQGQRSLG